MINEEPSSSARLWFSDGSSNVLYPRLLVMMSTPAESAHSTAAIQKSSSARTSTARASVRASMYSAPYAGPTSIPASFPAITDRTCAPCESGVKLVEPVMKSFVWTTFT